MLETREKLNQNEERVKQLTERWTGKWAETAAVLQVRGSEGAALCWSGVGKLSLRDDVLSQTHAVAKVVFCVRFVVQRRAPRPVPRRLHDVQLVRDQPIFLGSCVSNCLSFGCVRFCRTVGTCVTVVLLVVPQEHRTLALRRCGAGVVLDSELPYFLALEDDVLSTGMKLYHLREGDTTVGRDDAVPLPDIGARNASNE